jgi:hypothetical protein
MADAYHLSQVVNSEDVAKCGWLKINAELRWAVLQRDGIFCYASDTDAQLHEVVALSSSTIHQDDDSFYVQHDAFFEFCIIAESPELATEWVTAIEAGSYSKLRDACDELAGRVKVRICGARRQVQNSLLGYNGRRRSSRL